MFGTYVTYKNETFLCTSVTGNMAKILRANQTKLNVKVTNLQPTNLPVCRAVHYRNSEYLVTPKKAIISCKTERIMQWDDSNGSRKAILAMAELISLDL